MKKYFLIFMLVCPAIAYAVNSLFCWYAISVVIKNNTQQIHQSNAESFRVTLIDTGLQTKTAGRLKKVQNYVENETFMLTYGDGVSDVDITKLIEFHKSHKGLASVTAVQPSGRFGIFNLKQGQKKVNGFRSDKLILVNSSSNEGGRGTPVEFFILKST